MKKHFLAFMIVMIAVLSFGLGALSDSLLGDVMLELNARYYRELVWRDMLAPLSPEAGAYFQGRADATAQCAELVLRANATGTTTPNVRP